MSRKATALSFVIPTGAKRSGGTCSFLDVGGPGKRGCVLAGRGCLLAGTTTLQEWATALTFVIPSSARDLRFSL